MVFSRKPLQDHDCRGHDDRSESNEQTYLTDPHDVDELRFLAVGVITDKELLKGMFNLFAAVLDQLCRIRWHTSKNRG